MGTTTGGSIREVAHAVLRHLTRSHRRRENQGWPQCDSSRLRRTNSRRFRPPTRAKSVNTQTRTAVTDTESVIRASIKANHHSGAVLSETSGLGVVTERRRTLHSGAERRLPMEEAEMKVATASDRSHGTSTEWEAVATPQFDGEMFTTAFGGLRGIYTWECDHLPSEEEVREGMCVRVARLPEGPYPRSLHAALRVARRIHPRGHRGLRHRHLEDLTGAPDPARGQRQRHRPYALDDRITLVHRGGVLRARSERHRHAPRLTHGP